MDPRERIKLALDRKPVDRMPIDFGSTRSTSISTIAYERLRKKLGINSGLSRMYDFIQQNSYVEMEVIEKFNVDIIDPGMAFLRSEDDWTGFTIPHDGTRCLVPKYLFQIYDIERDEKDTIYLKHKDGTVLGIMPATSVNVRQAYWPYKDLPAIPETFDNRQLNKYSWAYPTPPYHLDNSLTLEETSEDGFDLVADTIKTLHRDTDRALIFGVGGNAFDIGGLARGFDNFLCDVYRDKKGTKRLIDHTMEFYMDYIDKVIDRIGPYVEVLVFGDDLGHQGGPLISPDIYREIFKPAHKKMWEHVHSRCSCKVFLHSCGSLYELIPDMIDAGLDILNPVQTNAANMEPERLKREFGRDLIFWGGGCEPRTLALKGPQDVMEEVRQRIDIFAQDGGFVFASLHNITAEVPAENIIAMFEAANEYGGY